MSTEETQDLVTALIPTEPAQMKCYEGVPIEVADECENIYTVVRTVRLQGLRRIRDKLAPYGQFRQWCHDHDENYGSVQDALSQAYGNVSSRTVKENLIGRLLEGPAETEAQTIIQAQAERVRVLEAQLKAYEGRSADEWAAEATRRKAEAEEDALALARADADVQAARYSVQFLKEYPWSEDWAEGQVSAEVLEEIREADERIAGHMGILMHCDLATALMLLHWRWKQRNFGALLEQVAARWLRHRGLPLTEATRAGAQAYWEWVIARAEEYGLDAPEGRQAFVRYVSERMRFTSETEISATVTRARAVTFLNHTMEVWATLARACGQEWAMDDASDAPGGDA